MSTPSVVLVIGGVLLVALGLSRARGPWGRYQALRAREENAERYRAWRGGPGETAGGTTGADVIHSWAVPAFGVKMDAIPGRINRTWFKATAPGTYYGECSELCGANHAFMPIEVKVVSEADYDAWIARSKKKFAANDMPDAARVAADN